MTQEVSVATQMFTNIAYAIIILAIGFWGAKMIARLVKGLMERRDVDQALTGFVENLINALVVTFAVIAALNKLGIQTTSLIAVVGAAGLAIGLALKDSLGNFAAGVMILIFKQFKAGDFIEAAGVLGVVETLNVFSTQLKTGDNKTVYVPNGKLIGDNIINYSTKSTRRIDMVIGVSYDADLSHVKKVLEDILAKESRILEDPAPTIGVLALADNSVNFAFRPWVNAADYWGVHFDLHAAIKTRFDEEGIGIPYPQRDVHLYQQEASAK
ncbi:MAG: mechanosensitive ion channel [Desulfuromonadales bacterium]|nr:mechanosensitive ion channel [Desulfuromonadales bacterium]MDH3870284.1 mechanosensitive ion channel [Desulfuromonadales bacterium]